MRDVFNQWPKFNIRVPSYFWSLFNFITQWWVVLIILESFLFPASGISEVLLAFFSTASIHCPFLADGGGTCHQLARCGLCIGQSARTWILPLVLMWPWTTYLPLSLTFLLRKMIIPLPSLDCLEDWADDVCSVLIVSGVVQTGQSRKWSWLGQCAAPSFPETNVSSRALVSFCKYSKLGLLAFLLHFVVGTAFSFSSNMGSSFLHAFSKVSFTIWR